MPSNFDSIKNVPAPAIDDLEFVRILFSVIQGIATALSSVLSFLTQLMGFGGA
ncbi:MAG: hypothetical protein HYV27_06560 [Candidatus Hydrogenedentes bacterium]|nr:hypothetical protein [Candidatus Hydrogenedentota bacterium]